MVVLGDCGLENLLTHHCGGWMWRLNISVACDNCILGEMMEDGAIPRASISFSFS